MANATIKPAAIPREGYEYQDLVGIETLIRFYRDPHLFRWVKLEADENQYGALDDVVVARSEGTFDFVQVKFTVDSSVNALDWDWLLKKRPKGTSLLEKWATSVRRVRSLGQVSSCSLRTNRTPSASFKAAMIGSRVDLMLIEQPLRTQIENECGGRAEAEVFFKVFEFHNITESLDSLEARLKLELIPSDLLHSGWLYFRNQVRRWAIRRDEPPGGKILHQHLAQIISRQRPEPISQNFGIPDAYVLPSQLFHDTFLKRISDPKTPVTILWGTPGRGKSTYLSYLTNDLRNKNKAVVRHHYFLSGDDTADRISYAEIAHSLVHQLTERYPDVAPGQIDEVDQLNKTLAAIAGNFKRKNKQLYVIIDGLDHVWRDYQQVDQLNHLFNQIFPLPENVFLVVGTQRVPNNQLPNRMVANTVKSDWISLPSMDQIAVKQWIDHQNSAGRLILRDHLSEETQDEALQAISSKFYEISAGHPLHLIYAFETLARRGIPVDTEEVALLPSCPDGDIRRYYDNLWNKLSAVGREILHALAGSEFHWPSLGLRQCIGDYDEIGHLLELRNSGVLPFHASLFAFVREKDNHTEVFQILLPRIVSWLDKDAPPYWRWGWLWLSKAKQGDYSALMEGASREWAVASLAQGWPEKQISRILDEAEKHALQQLDLPTAVKLRSINHRVMNAREFQIPDYTLFEEVSIRSSNNEQQLKNLFDDLTSLSGSDLAMLPLVATTHMSGEICHGCEQELLRRINIWLELRHWDNTTFLGVVHNYLRVLSLCATSRTEQAWKVLSLFVEPSDHVRYFIKQLAFSRGYEALLELRTKLSSDTKWQSEIIEIDDQILRTACAIGANPLTRISINDRGISPLFACWCYLQSHELEREVPHPPVPAKLIAERYDIGIDYTLKSFIETLFFSALAHTLSDPNPTTFKYPGLPASGLGWLSEALDLVTTVAKRIGAGELPADISGPFIGTEDLEPVYLRSTRTTERDQAQYRSFVAALRTIAFDLHLIGAKRGRVLIGLEELKKARTSVHWSDEVWLETSSEFTTPIMTKDAASYLLNSDAAKFDQTITVLNERARDWALRARIATIHGLEESILFTKRSTNCLLGYGYRKDPWIHEVLDAVEAVHDPDNAPALKWILDLFPIIDKITQFTDGSGTHHARTEIIGVIARTYPNLIPSVFKHHLDSEEWEDADECLRQFAKVSSLRTSEEEALVSTFLDPRVLCALKEKANVDAQAKVLFDKQVKFLGTEPTNHADRYHSTSALNDKKPADNNRGVGDFEEVIADADGCYDSGERKEHFRRWMNLHKASGKGKELLQNINDYFENNTMTLHAEDALGAAFELSLEVEGRDAAYKWLVLDHIAHHGWQKYWTSHDGAMARLKLVAQHYPERWKDYIQDTSRPAKFLRRRGSGLVIGASYLVEFLLLLNQQELAAQIVDEMVQSVIEEVTDISFEDAAWLTNS